MQNLKHKWNWWKNEYWTFLYINTVYCAIFLRFKKNCLEYSAHFLFGHLIPFVHKLSHSFDYFIFIMWIIVKEKKIVGLSKRWTCSVYIMLPRVIVNIRLVLSLSIIVFLELPCRWQCVLRLCVRSSGTQFVWVVLH